MNSSMSCRPVPVQRRLVFGALVAIVVGVLPAAALAAELGVGRGVVVFPFEGFDLPLPLEKTPNDLHAFVELHFRTAGWEVSASPLLLRDLMAALRCTGFDAGCAASLAEHLKVDAIVIGKLIVEGAGVVAVLRRYDADGTRLLEIKQPVSEEAGARPAVWKSLAEGLVRGVWPLPPVDAERRAVVAAPKSGGRLPLAPIALGAAGLALGGGALAAAFVAAGAQRALDALGPLDTADDFETAAPIDARGRTAALTGQILVAAAGAAVLTAAVLALVLSRPKRAPASLAFVPAPGVGALVLVVLR